MITNYQMKQYLQRKDTFDRLEDMLDESLRWFNEDHNFPKNDAETESIAREDILITTQDDAGTLIDSVYRRVTDLLPLRNIQKPDITVCSDFDFVMANVTVGIPRILPSLLVPGLTLGIYGASSGNLGLVYSACGAICGTSIALLVPKVYIALNSTGVLFSKSTPHRILLKAHRKSGFALVLAHEIAHSIHLQNLSLHKRSYLNSWEYSMIFEGLAEVVAKDACMQLDSEKGGIYREKTMLELICHTVKVYQNICDLWRIPKSKRRSISIEGDENFQYSKCNCYDFGYVGVELLKRRHGNGVLIALAEGNSVDI